MVFQEPFIALSCYVVRFVLNHIYKGNEPHGPYKCWNRIEGLNGGRYDAQDVLVPSHLTCIRCYRSPSALTPSNRLTVPASGVSRVAPPPHRRTQNTREYIAPPLVPPFGATETMSSVIVCAQGTSPSRIFSASAVGSSLDLVKCIRK